MTGTVFAYTDSQDFGGAEQALAILLVGLRDAGWWPTLLHPGAAGLEPLLRETAAAGIPDRVVPATPLGVGGALRAPGLVALLRRERPAVFHAHLTWPLACKWALAAACVARVPAVLATAQLFVDVEIPWTQRPQVWALSRRVDRLIAVSEHTKERFHEALGWPEERIAVVHNAVAVERFGGPPDPAVRSEIDDGSGRPIALVPARLAPEKGHRHLLAAATKLPGVRFVCVGDGALRDELAEEARRLGVSERVTFLGRRRDMPALLAACDLVVLPSLAEGLPLSLIEAMASHRPVVATDIGGTRELVDGETGVLVAPGDPDALAAGIGALLADDDRRERLAAAGWRRARARFDSPAMVEGVLALYDSLLAREAGPRPSRRAPDWPTRVLRAFARARAGRPTTFVQIGSNDGTTGDPLRALADAYGWHGLLVEPVPYVFARLRRERGGNPRLRLANVAVSDRDGQAEFHHLRERRDTDGPLPEWYDQLGSFSLRTILSHEEAIPRIRELLVSTTVPTLTFDSLCARHAIDAFELLHIDAEGYDWEILRTVDLERYRPTLVLYEHAHLSAADRGAARERLDAAGYACDQGPLDTLAVRRQALAEQPGLRRAWRRLARARGSQ
ncbi:MAG TPA: FkbM family methyltransferase [Solirubrobacteraceae bacterium]|jgi:FkbM family methyltransferase|nr:FkbM family methyltransferase [Solirubrobacteraceae bacterium]